MRPAVGLVMEESPVAEGDVRHPDHEAWLLALGRAAYEAARVAGISFDILRVHRGTPSDEMYEDALGTLLNRLRRLRRQRPDLPGMESFLGHLEQARITRNDLIHALPVRDGLYRRTAGVDGYVREFFDIASLEAAARQLSGTAIEGNALLHHDAGAAIRVWYASGGS